MESLRGKRLVIFGCGYVGGAVARKAAASGMKVSALTRNESIAAALAAAGIEVVVADLASDTWHSQIAGGAECVLNCVSSGGGGLEGYRHSYLEGMRSILRWARGRGAAGTLVYTSSTSVYPQDGGVVVDETASHAGVSERGSILLETERDLQSARDAWQRYFVLRLAGIYGPERHHLLEQVRSGEVAGRGEHHLNLVHREDIVAAVMACFAAEAAVSSAVFNVADDAPAPKAVVVSWLAKRLGVAEPRFTGEPAGTRRMVTPDRRISNGRIKSTLGWNPAFPDFRAGYENVLSC